ncbi:uncharacterized protein LOC116608352 [Nematostella vectensis]|uniref:uncharacterized protein LOC116608352 n=1 Tax=Nematostella vectensis TaxID=45351 RepID=UPI0013901007|nr:uncharacterized protein LOC116608352 [Nematostella vectensis]
MASKGKPEVSEEKEELPKFHQNFFTVPNEQEEDAIPELKTTIRDPQNHYIEVEFTENYKQSKKTGSCCGGVQNVSPPPFIKVDLNKNIDVDLAGILLKTNGKEQGFLHAKEVDDVKFKSSKPKKDELPPASPVDKDLLEDPGVKPLANAWSFVQADAKTDIPTTYQIPRLAAHELPVVGTFVHQHVVPGFPYRVRLNGTKEFLFEGNPLVLQSVGQGYGKRLSFESEDVLYNENYFWSDSNPEEGYAFSISLSLGGHKYSVLDRQGKALGNVEILKNGEKQVVKKKRFNPVSVELETKVNLRTKLWLKDAGKEARDVNLLGVAIATKYARQPCACVERIVDVEIPGCGVCSFVKVSRKI